MVYLCHMKGGSPVSRILAAWHNGETQQSVASVKSKGFTIVEVLIVLAVTGALFLSAAIIISGRTNRTQFEQSINEITARIRVTINEVSTGFYPNMNNFQCTRNGAATQISSGNAEQGTNADCVFLGKVMQFGVPDTDPQQYVIYPVAALRTDAQGNEIQNLTAASAKAIAPTTSQPSRPNSSSSDTLQYGLTAVEVYYKTSASGAKNAIGAFGFMNSQAQYANSQIVSGSTQVSLVPIPGTSLNQSTTAAAQAIDTALAQASTPVNPAGGVFICFKSGGTNQSGLVQIGGSGGRQLSVTLKIVGNQSCQ